MWVNTVWTETVQWWLTLCGVCMFSPMSVWASSLPALLFTKYVIKNMSSLISGRCPWLNPRGAAQRKHAAPRKREQISNSIGGAEYLRCGPPSALPSASLPGVGARLQQVRLLPPYLTDDMLRAFASAVSSACVSLARACARARAPPTRGLWW